MKFSNGCWLQKEGCACFSPAEVYFTKIEKDKVVLCAPTHKINHRGDTLGGINLTVEITTPMPEVIRVKTYHYKGAIQDGPQFALNLPDQTAIDATEDDEKIVVKSGNAKLVITKENWSMTYYNGDKKLCTSAWRDLAYMKTDWKGDAYVKSVDKDAYMRQQLSLGVGELIYGLGERFAAFTRNGQSIDIWNEDGGTSTDQSYKNIPFYISNRGYGVFVNHTEKVSFEVATEAVTKVEFSVPGESLDYFFFNGPDLKDVLRRYTDLTGKPALPPAWTFGLWLSTSFTTNYDEKTVMSFIDGMLDRGIPLKVFHFDCFWMKDFHWTDFLWDERVFPDPEGMLSRIKAKGLKICVWINPYIAQESVMFDEGMEGGYFLKRPDGSVWQWDMWQPGMAIVDFTNPEAKKWYQKKLEALVDMGVTVLRRILVREFQPIVFIMTRKIRKKCTIIIPIYIMKLYLKSLRKRKEKMRRCFLPDLLPQVDRSSRYTGAETAGPIMNPWKKVCVEDYLCSFPDSVSGAMISADLKILLPRMSIRDGVRLVCFLLTAVCMEVHHTVCRGLMTMRPWMCCAALYA